MKIYSDYLASSDRVFVAAKLFDDNYGDGDTWHNGLMTKNYTANQFQRCLQGLQIVLLNASQNLELSYEKNIKMAIIIAIIIFV
ncbi:MAG: hypothetical protein H6543_03330 [Prevotellaceae bacterium]|nr:hypothetical protein [Prevotellaceae bacterium]